MENHSKTLVRNNLRNHCCTAVLTQQAWQAVVTPEVLVLEAEQLRIKQSQSGPPSSQCPTTMGSY